jgi:flagellar hook-basal body complex protein FliE
MSSNLSIENLSRTIQAGDTEQLLGNNPAVSENLAIREMHKNGMEAPSADAQGEGAKTFSGVLRDSIDKVNTYQHEADRAVKELVAGRSKNIHETMLTIERADTSLKLMMQVRNKILDAYREIMRMQV